MYQGCGVGSDGGTFLFDEEPEILYEFEKPRTFVFSLVQWPQLLGFPFRPLLENFPILPPIVYCFL